MSLSRSRLPNRAGASRRLLTLALLLAGLAAVAAGAETAPDRDAVLGAFEVMDLSDRIVLRPRAAAASFDQIELPDEGDEALVNGRALGERELASWLGKDGELAAGLLRLSAEERRSALGLAARSAAAEGVDGAEGPSQPTVPRPPRPPRVATGASSDARVSFGRSVTVERDETAEEVVCFAGALDVLGVVEGNAVVIGGTLRISGKVMGDAVVVGGSMTLEDGAEIYGEAVAVGGTVSRHANAKIYGRVSEVAVGDGLGRAIRRETEREIRHELRHGFASEAADLWGWMVTFLVFVLLVALMLLVAERPVEAVAARARFEMWSAALAGLLTQLLFVPLLVLVIVVLVISIIGIPLLLLLPFLLLGFAVAMLVGFAGVCVAAGRWFAERMGRTVSGRYAVAIVGLVLIVAFSFLGELLDLAPFLGALAVLATITGVFAQYFAWTIGLGAVILGLLARGRDRRAAATLAALPPTPPPAPAAAIEEPGTAPEALPPADAEAPADASPPDERRD